jgi:murein DD-endopeptidase MepM/ murein hydrolase activator NlpD
LKHTSQPGGARRKRARTALGAAAAVVVLPLVAVGGVAAQETTGDPAPDQLQQPAAQADANPPQQPGAEGAATRQKLDPTFGEQEQDSAGQIDNPRNDGDRIRPVDRESPVVKTSVNRKAFFESKKPPEFTFELDYGDDRFYRDHEISVKVDLQRRKTNEEVERWKLAVDGPKTQRVTWKGLQDGELAAPGKYEFKLVPLIDGKPTKAKGDDKLPQGDFRYYTHWFPVAGHHDFGSKGARFGAGRKGHSHQGQDVFAKCGTPLVAARAGKIQANQYQSSAGFYLVIDGDKTEVDYVYMHMDKRSKFREHDKVKTGEKIGAVGETGNAQGCHLHYEMWEKPGWFEGGKPYDPLPQLKGWDKFS